MTLEDAIEKAFEVMEDMKEIKTDNEGYVEEVCEALKLLIGVACKVLKKQN